jgi:RNA polymerase sigma factor (sigma-70 family)
MNVHPKTHAFPRAQLMKITDDSRRSLASSPGARPGRTSIRAPASAWLLTYLPDWPATWAAYVRRVHTWRVPPRWSPVDWWEELDAQALASACEAVHTFDATRGLSRSSYVFHRMLAATLTRSRREWAYALSFLRCPTDEPLVVLSDDHLVAREDGQLLREALSQLHPTERKLIERLFWEGCSEAEIGSDWGVSQQAVSERKRKILRELRRSIEKRTRNSE